MKKLKEIYNWSKRFKAFCVICFIGIFVLFFAGGFGFVNESVCLFLALSLGGLSFVCILIADKFEEKYNKLKRKFLAGI